MKKWSDRIVGVLLLLVIAAGSLLFPGVRTLIVEMNLPDFPDWPAAKTELTATDAGKIYFETHSPFDFQVILAGIESTPTTGLGYLTFPQDKTDNLPAMVILPGSGGIKPGREHEYASFLNANGVAALVIEYYEARGLSEEVNYLIRTGSVTEFDLITDAFAALELLSTHPGIDASRIGVMGFSYGGMATRLAMDDRIREALAPEHPGFAVHIDVYGPCFQDLGTKKTNGAPLLTLRGTNDASNDLEACTLRENQLRDIGVDVQAIVYEGAGHAWENDQAEFFSSESPYLAGCEWNYDAAGVPLLNGEPLVDYGANAPRAQRIAERLISSTKLGDCVQYGYLIGRNEQVREQAYSDALEFLQRELIK